MNQDEILLQTSINELKSLLDGESPLGDVLSQNALFNCCQIVGQHQGLKFQNVSTAMQETDLTLDQHLNQLCLKSQIYYRKIRLENGWWKTLDFPFVGLYGKDLQPKAFIPSFTKGYQVIDPLTQDSKEATEDIADQVLKEGYLFYRSLPDHKLSLRNIWSFSIWHRKKEWFTFLCLSFCSLLLSFSIPLLTSFLFDHVIPNRDSELLLQIGLGALFIILVTLVFNFNRESLLLRLTGLINQDLELAIWQRMMNLPVNFFRKYTLYDLFTFTSALSSIRQLVTSQVLMVVFNVFFSLFFLIPLFYYGQKLAIVALIVLAVQFFLILLFLPSITSYGRQLINRQIQTSNKTFEIIQAISKIRLSTSELRFFHRWEHTFALMKRMELKMLLLKMKMAIFNTFFSSTGLGVIYFFIIFLLASNGESQTLSLGSFMAFMSAFSFINGSMQQITNTIMRVSLAIPLWEKIRDFSKTEIQVFSTKADPGILKGEILVDGVSFSYSANELPIIQDVSFKIDPGSSVAFIGLSGSGKSTLIRLLLGFESPTHGSIYYDNQEIKSLNLQILRSQLGVVLQTGSILDGTILDNITLGRNYNETAIQEAVANAGMSSFIKELPMGMDTVLTNGGLALSGGQRQMILLARALVGKPKILILDEATSSLDSQKQREIQVNLSRLSMTRIIVTQRIDILKEEVDKIFVIEKGKISFQGAFDDR